MPGLAGYTVFYVLKRMTYLINTKTNIIFQRYGNLGLQKIWKTTLIIETYQPQCKVMIIYTKTT